MKAVCKITFEGLNFEKLLNALKEIRQLIGNVMEVIL